MAWTFGFGSSRNVCSLVVDRRGVVGGGGHKRNLFKGAFLDGFASNDVNRYYLDIASRNDMQNLTAEGVFAAVTWHERKSRGGIDANQHEVLIRRHTGPQVCIRIP